MTPPNYQRAGSGGGGVEAWEEPRHLRSRYPMAYSGAQYRLRGVQVGLIPNNSAFGDPWFEGSLAAMIEY